MLQSANLHYDKQINDAVLLGSEPNSIQELFRKQPVERLVAGQSLFFEGDAAKHLFEVVEGTLRIFKIISDGRRVITGFLHAGDIVGVSLKDRYLYSAEAITNTKVRRFSRKAFDNEVAGSPQLRPEVFARLCDEMAAAQDQMVLLSCKSAEERICTFLLRELLRAASDGEVDFVIELPMTRLDIADYLGLTIETVSRSITKLTSKGVLAPVGRHSLRVVKRSALVQLSGGDDELARDGWKLAGCERRPRH
ncbi:cyclic nucleotide-binding domain-containing protein [Rhizobium mesosinicum]|uniref:Helix-turn-helix domain-containing protein n=1 Tax=Rhizobium mesosinicum TaxID=335017 RepID=A0ABS7GQX5_9HYPH|nr:cyclic nucleotide-binding domain-containing protein [Rhizobium mesosinicum]MBW9052349.1 helix-turn-helix domain-containing protein [Rhizobium mesosinicum]